MVRRPKREGLFIENVAAPVSDVGKGAEIGGAGGHFAHILRHQADAAEAALIKPLPVAQLRDGHRGDIVLKSTAN